MRRRAPGGVARRSMKLLCLGLMAVAVGIGATTARSAAAAEINWHAHRATVVFFILHDCPICNSYAPEMNRLAGDYGGRGFGFIAAYEDAGFTEAEARRHTQEYRIGFPFVIDADRQLATKAGVKVAPEAAVFDSRGRILYRGRIDDLYADIGERRPAAQEHDLRDALEAIVAGSKPKRAIVPGVGCLLEPIR